MRHKMKRDKTRQFKSLNVFLPEQTVEYIKKLSVERQVPMSRLVAYAVDNEMAVQNPFYFPCAIPEEGDERFYPESAKVLGYMMHFGTSGISADMLVLARREMGFDDPDVILESLALLLDKRMIVERKCRYTDQLKYAPVALKKHQQHRRFKTSVAEMEKKNRGEDDDQE